MEEQEWQEDEIGYSFAEIEQLRDDDEIDDAEMGIMVGILEDINDVEDDSEE